MDSYKVPASELVKQCELRRQKIIGREKAPEELERLKKMLVKRSGVNS